LNTTTFAETQETPFEKQRGISRVEIRDGFAQIHISQLPDPLMDARLEILQVLADNNISIDFLKLTQTGLAFLVQERSADQVATLLASKVPHHSVHRDQSIVMVSAVNMRDEEGLLARVVAVSIGCGVQIDHLGDMHDQLLIVTSRDGAREIAGAVKDQLMEVPS